MASAMIAASVSQVAGIGKKEVARLHLTAVVGHPRRGDTEGGQAVENLTRRAHSFPFPDAASATWIGSSGAMPSVRRAPPMICENTGPATSPP